MRFSLIVGCFFLSFAASAAEISIAVAHQPPYLDEETKSGMFLETISEALAAAGHVAKPIFLPARRGVALFENKEIEGSHYYFGDKAEGSCKTESYGDYQPGAIALKTLDSPIKSLADVKGRRVGAFVGAKDFFTPFHPDYPQAMTTAAEYREDDVVRITRLASNGRIDIVLMDWRLFLWMLKNDNQEYKYKADDFQKNPVFGEAWISAQFWKKEYCDDFNRGLAMIKANGRYDAIRKKYADALQGAPVKP